MKTWNDLEIRLRQAATPAPAADLHHRILRAARDDRAAASVHEPRTAYGLWLLAGTAACALAVTVFQFRAVRTTPDLDTPALSFAMLETFAASPVENEWTNLRSDLVAAAQFVSDCVPVGGERPDAL